MSRLELRLQLRLQQALISLAVLGTAAGPALAASSASSASSDGSSASVGSLSTSIEKSSNSSKADTVAEGDYRIVDVAVADKQPGKMRLTLRALNPADGEWVLTLPQEAVAQARLVAGGVVTARQHAYGVQFAAGAPREAFFLVLQDAWYEELRTKAVTL